MKTQEIHEVMENVRKYCNMELLKISKTYKQVVPCIRKTGHVNSFHWGNFKARASEVEFDRLFEYPWIKPNQLSDLKIFLPKIVNDDYIIPKKCEEVEQLFIYYVNSYGRNKTRGRY